LYSCGYAQVDHPMVTKAKAAARKQGMTLSSSR
jgi:hypothetical protein